MIANQVISVKHKNNFLLAITNKYSHEQIGPYFLPSNSDNYRHFLENQLPVLLENMPVRERAQLIFQRNRAPANF